MKRIAMAMLIGAVFTLLTAGVLLSHSKGHGLTPTDILLVLFDFGITTTIAYSLLSKKR